MFYINITVSLINRNEHLKGSLVNQILIINLVPHNWFIASWFL